MMQLETYTVGSYTCGASFLQQTAWHFLGTPLLRSYLIPFSSFKVLLLRSFGAKIGQGVRIKPGVKIKFPWRLIVGDYVWIGEDSWIDNLANVTIESNVCISQGVYLCTGNHDWIQADFALKTEPIYIESSSWLAAKCIVGPGVRLGKGAILTLGGVAVKSLEPMTIYAGNPAQAIKIRKHPNKSTSISHSCSNPIDR
jgi:putative colanic acid biosynthesis acetyltransferase WcaF